MYELTVDEIIYRDAICIYICSELNIPLVHNKLSAINDGIQSCTNIT